MSKKQFTKTFGSPLMRELIKKAAALNIDIDFHVNSDGRYVINHPKSRTGYVAPNVGAACYFIYGMMAMVATPAGDLLKATWVMRPPVQKLDALGRPNNGIAAPGV